MKLAETPNNILKERVSQKVQCVFMMPGSYLYVKNIRFITGMNDVATRLTLPDKTPKAASFRPPKTVNSGVLTGHVPTVKPKAKDPIQPEKSTHLDNRVHNYAIINVNVACMPNHTNIPVCRLVALNSVFKDSTRTP